MTLRHEYLLLALAIILLVTNCLGASFTTKRNLFEKKRRAYGSGASLDVTFGWTKIYGRLAVAQGVAVMLALSATAINFSRSIVALLRSLF
jgi:hypothetical protein